MKKFIPVVSMLALASIALVSCGGSIYDTEATYTGRVALIDGTDTSGSSWDPVTATNEVERVLNSKGNAVDVVLSNNDGMALGIIQSETFKKAGIPIFGVDALDDALTAVKNGTMQGTIKNDSFTQANVALQLVDNLLTKKPIETGITGKIDGAYDKYETDAKAFRVHHKIITKDNVDQFNAPDPVTSNVIGKIGGKKVFVLTYQNSDPNMSGLWKPGFDKFGKDLNYEVHWTDGQGDDQKALEALAAAANDSSYEAFLINPVDQTNVLTYINKVKATGKPCIIWNREGSKEAMKTYEHAYYVGIESAEGGRLQGQMAAEWFNKYYTSATASKFDRNGDGKIGYVVVRGEKGHPDAEARTVASPEYLEKNLTIFKK